MPTLADVTITPNRDRQRQHAKERKRRHRERIAAQKAAQAIAEAATAKALADAKEIRDEELAPAILRESIGSLRGPRIRIVDGRPVQGPDLSYVPERSRRAAHQLRLDWQDVGAGCGATAVDYGATGGGCGDGLGGHQAMILQINARLRLEGAHTWLGDLWPAVARVVLDCISVTAWAEEENARRKQPLTGFEAVAHISNALHRLAAYYWPPRDVHDKRGFLTFGPPREAYDMSIPHD